MRNPNPYEDGVDVTWIMKGKKMVGGWIISNESVKQPETGRDVQRIWCADRRGDECAVYAEPAASVLESGEQIWWQSGKIMARGDKETFDKIGYSFQP
jgi:hypothetical protein